MQVLMLFALVGLAIGGVAWVFVYPILSGERAAERRVASVARPQPMAARQVRTAQKARREQVEGSLKQLEARSKKARRAPLSVRITQAGLNWSQQRFIVISAALGAVGLIVPFITGMGLLASLAPGLRHGVRPAALDPVVAQEAPRIALPRTFSRCRRRDRARHQGRPAAARQSEADRRRLAGAHPRRIPRHHRNADHRHAAR